MLHVTIMSYGYGMYFELAYGNEVTNELSYLSLLNMFVVAYGSRFVYHAVVNSVWGRKKITILEQSWLFVIIEFITGIRYTI